MFGRTRNGRPVPLDKWYWSAEPTHPAIIDRATWDAAHPDHPRTVAAREDLLLAQLYDGLTTYALGLGCTQRLAQLISAEATAQQALNDARATGIKTRLKQISVSQDSLIHELAILTTDPADSAAMAMRARIRQHYSDLHTEHERFTRQLTTLTQQAPPVHDPALIDLLPNWAAAWPTCLLISRPA